ncbi:hypothetical protein [Helicobacter brantae]|uniref:hypothetical protein n=1 Tax=Helicobacter brantae TaxID=375927 RepID=UPI0011C06172|nr:hypothetical protein [Helicobacter brantae]
MRFFQIFVFLSVVLLSQELSPQPIAPQSKIRLSGDLNLGINYYQYKEPDVMDITGPMFSLEGSFGVAYKLFKFQLDGFFSTHLGANEYNGGLYNSATKETIAYSTESQDWYLGIASRAGMAFSVAQREVAFIYAGFGYRFLHNMMIDKPNIKASYERDQGYLYFLLGVDGEVPINRLFSFLAEFQYRQLMYGHQMSGMKELGYDDDFYFTQTDGFGGRVSLGGKFYFHNQIALKLKLYFDFWAIENSDLVAGYQGGKYISTFVEPRNFTRVFGASVGVSF